MLFILRGWSENLPTGKNYASERARLGLVAGFNPPECKGEPPPGARASVITLVPAPSKFKHISTHGSTLEQPPTRNANTHLHTTSHRATHTTPQTNQQPLRAPRQLRQMIASHYTRATQNQTKHAVHKQAQSTN